MARNRESGLVAHPAPAWRKNRPLLREGYADLTYLPPDPVRWDATLCAKAYAVRQELWGDVDLNLWAAMNGLTPSGRYAELGREAVVLWHGTAAYKARQILVDGFRPVNRRAVYCSRNPSVSHGYTRFRSQEQEGGSAMFVLVLSKKEMIERYRFQESRSEVRLYDRVPPSAAEYVLWSDRIDFVGDHAAREEPKPWSRFPFKKKGCVWAPQTNPPVRFDDHDAFSTKEEWLRLSLTKMMKRLGPIAAIEAFSMLYSTIEPWEALTHKEVFAALEELCPEPRLRHQTWVFSLGEEA